MTPAYVDAPQPRRPIIRDVFTFAVLGPHHLVDVVADFVEEDVSKEHRPQETDPQEHRWGTGDDLIDKQLYPGRLSFPSLVVESGRISVPHLPAETPRPLALAGTCQRAGVSQHHLAESDEMLWRNGREQIPCHLASVTRRGVVPIGFDNLGHQESDYSGRQLDGVQQRALEPTSAVLGRPSGE
jgi:hypothetical protein